jgi:hypothetical protein
MHRDNRIWQAIFKTRISPRPLEIFTVVSMFDFAQADVPVTSGTLRVSIGWPDISRLFSPDSWRAIEDFFHDPFAARGTLERWMNAGRRPVR